MAHANESDDRNMPLEDPWGDGAVRNGRTLPKRIIPLPFVELQQAAVEQLEEVIGAASGETSDRMHEKLMDLMFHLNAMIFLDGENRADSLMSRLSRWSGPGFTKRFFISKHSCERWEFSDDLRFIAENLRYLLHSAHYQSLPEEIVKKAISDMSYERIFVRLQHIDFLKYFVRGSYIARQRESLPRSVVKKIRSNKRWVNHFLAPDEVEVYEEVVVIVAERITEQEQETPDLPSSQDPDTIKVDPKQMAEEISEAVEQKSTGTMRSISKRRQIVKKIVEEKLKTLQDKKLDDFIREQCEIPQAMHQLHLLVYHHIPTTDLELLIPNSEISLGVKEYIQLCFTGSVTVSALGQSILKRGLKRLLWIFNPIIFALFRVFHRVNFIRLEQKYLHANYRLKRLLARGSRAISHLVDDYENVIKREAVLIYSILYTHRTGLGMTLPELEQRANQWLHERFGVSIDPDFKPILELLEKWGLIARHTIEGIDYYHASDVNAALEHTRLTRDNLKGKIWMETGE